MKTMNVAEMQVVNAGKKYTYTERCSICRKKYSASVSYAWWSVFSYLTARTSAMALARKKTNNCAYRDLGF